MKHISFYDITKNTFQCFLVVLEFVGVAFLFVWLTNKYIPCDNFIDCLERGSLGLAIYEFIIFITLTFINDANKDAYNALNTVYKHAIIACESNNDLYLKKVIDEINSQQESDMMNLTKIHNEYDILQTLLMDKDVDALKYRQTTIECLYEHESFQWKYTLLLRLFK